MATLKPRIERSGVTAAKNPHQPAPRILDNQGPKTLAQQLEANRKQVAAAKGS